jgi:hypothetical protein
MKQAKIIAYGLMASLGAALLVSMEVTPEDPWLSLAGIGMWVFGVWAIIVLFKNAK